MNNYFEIDRLHYSAENFTADFIDLKTVYTDGNYYHKILLGNE